MRRPPLPEPLLPRRRGRDAAWVTFQKYVAPQKLFIGPMNQLTGLRLPRGALSL